MTGLGITVYGCEPGEARVFEELCPRFGVVPTLITANACETSAILTNGNRCVSVGHKSEVSGRTLQALRDAGVEYLSTRSIGFDHIDLPAAERLGITVENVVYSPDGVADYTVMLILMLIREARSILDSVARNDFRLRPARGNDLRDMTVGVLGTGRIGTAVARRLDGFGCRVLTHSTRRTLAAPGFVPLDELLRQSDIVTLHVPLDTGTHHLIGRDELAAMKRGAFLVNTGRGALVDTGALVGALERGQLGGAALDVLEGEEGTFYVDLTSRPIDHRYLPRLLALPNVIVTPHTAYYTERALRDTVEQTLTNCLNFERNRPDAEAHDRDLVRGMF